MGKGDKTLKMHRKERQKAKKAREKRALAEAKISTRRRG